MSDVAYRLPLTLRFQKFSSHWTENLSLEQHVYAYMVSAYTYE